MDTATETSSLNSEQQGKQDEARKRFRHAALTSVLILCSLWCGALVLGAWHHDGRVPGQLSRLFFSLWWHKQASDPSLLFTYLQ